MLSESDYGAIVCWAQYLAERAHYGSNSTIDLSPYRRSQTVRFNNNKELWRKNINVEQFERKIGTSMPNRRNEKQRTTYSSRNMVRELVPQNETLEEKHEALQIHYIKEMYRDGGDTEQNQATENETKLVDHIFTKAF
ncbi:unnamed protein product [Gongylonema pulchrum]|uniref:Uncharacterized protein n=1 Tax=Gongylonema pulchrum TaxID=637853 RepID=A0A183EWP0_9BILA|nr:unnamed protein product [Gongylonema pulchrum]